MHRPIIHTINDHATYWRGSYRVTARGSVLIVANAWTRNANDATLVAEHHRESVLQLLAVPCYVCGTSPATHDSDMEAALVCPACTD